MPLSTAQTLFSHNREIDRLIDEPPTRPAGAVSIERTRTILGRHHRFKPADEEAVSFFNIVEAVKRVEGIGITLQIFLAACGMLPLAVSVS